MSDNQQTLNHTGEGVWSKRYKAGHTLIKNITSFGVALWNNKNQQSKDSQLNETVYCHSMLQRKKHN
jgi:hypothetical protein